MPPNFLAKRCEVNRLGILIAIVVAVTMAGTVAGTWANFRHS